MNLNYVLPSTGIKKRINLSAFQKIILGFMGIILLASLILMLPISSAEGVWTPFLDCLFTATSATCVTGLVVHDTATYWSEFGHVIIIIMIQIGGMGVITLGSLFVMAARKKISLAQRSAMQEAIAAQEMGGIVNYTKFIIKSMMIIEGAGAVLLAPVMISDFGIKGIWYSIFHSISAFCNAGFDLLGIREQYSSLTSYGANTYVNIVIMLLIVVGGIGFLTWEDIAKHGWRVSRYHMQTKVVLVTSLVLLAGPAIYYYFCDFGRELWGLSEKDRILASAFQSVTARTAGFNTVDLAQMTTSSLGIMIVLMLIGGSPGSTAGGLKTTTIAVLVMSMSSVFRRKDHTTCFGRRIEDDTVKNAAAIFMMYLILFFAGAILINQFEELPFLSCIFEAASAIGTVGVTLGITTSLGTASRIVIIILMFLGRVGGLTMIYATVAPPKAYDYKLPKEKIMVG